MLFLDMVVNEEVPLMEGPAMIHWVWSYSLSLPCSCLTVVGEMSSFICSKWVCALPMTDASSCFKYIYLSKLFWYGVVMGLNLVLFTFQHFSDAQDVYDDLIC